MRTPGREVIAYVANHFDLTVAELTGERRTRHVARPRQVAMYAMRHVCEHLSYPAIGGLLGGRDHTTVLHGVRKIGKLIETDDDIARAVSTVLSHFNRRKDRSASIFVESQIIAAERHLEALYCHARDVASVERRVAA